MLILHLAVWVPDKLYVYTCDYHVTVKASTIVSMVTVSHSDIIKTEVV